MKVIRAPQFGFIAEAKAEETPIARARRRHGKPFACEARNSFKMRETPFLTEWLSKREQKK